MSTTSDNMISSQRYSRTSAFYLVSSLALRYFRCLIRPSKTNGLIFCAIYIFEKKYIP